MDFEEIKSETNEKMSERFLIEGFDNEAMMAAAVFVRKEFVKRTVLDREFVKPVLKRYGKEYVSVFEWETRKPGNRILPFLSALDAFLASTRTEICGSFVKNGGNPLFADRIRSEIELNRTLESLSE